MVWIVMISPKTIAQKQIRDLTIAEIVLGIRESDLLVIKKKTEYLYKF